MQLSPADAEAFDGPNLRVTIVRNGAGAPTGFTVSTGRVRGLAFEQIG